MIRWQTFTPEAKWLRDYNVHQFCAQVYAKENSVTQLDPAGLRSRAGVNHFEGKKSCVQTLLLTSGTIPIHEDSRGGLPRYTYFAVIHNDGYIVKGPQQKRSEWKKQVPGTVFCLDIHEPHHLIRDARIAQYVENHPYPIWAAISFGHDLLFGAEEVAEKFNEFAARFFKDED